MKIFHLCRNAYFTLLKRKSVGVRILLIKDQQILLVKHTYMPGWYTVGGGVDAGESPREAIHRELKEEVGVTLTTEPKLFSVYHNTFEKRDDYIVFYVANDCEQIPVSSPEILEARWFGLDALPADATPATLRRIAEYQGKLSIDDKW